MTRYEHAIEIEAPIEYVFDWGTTPKNWQRVMPALTDIERIEETAEGTRYRNTMQLLGRSTTSDQLFTVIEPNSHTVSTFDGGAILGEVQYYYTETETGTNVHMVADLEAGTTMFDRMLQPIITRYVNRQLRNSLRTMRDLVESEARAHHGDPEATKAERAEMIELRP